MKRLRLFAFDASGVIGDRTYSRFPVRVGRHPQNELQIVDPRVSRFHAHFECESGVLVFRDVESENGTVVLDGDGSGRVVRSTEVRAPDGRLTVLIGGVRLQARIEEGEASELPEGFAPAARDAARAILSVCPLHGEQTPAPHGGAETIRPVLDALFDSLFMLRLGLHAAEIEPAEQRDEEPPRSETLSALIAWTHANAVALRVVEHALEAAMARDARLLSEGIGAIDALLRELAPEKLERETNDVSTEWPAARATAVLARYREAHRQLAQRHAREPSALLGKTFGELRLAPQSNEMNAAPSAERSSLRRARLRSEAFRTTSADTGEQPPSSDSK
jgi:hypothetical protein